MPVRRERHHPAQALHCLIANLAATIRPRVMHLAQHVDGGKNWRACNPIADHLPQHRVTCLNQPDDVRLHFNSPGQRPNNSFKPSPLRGLGAAFCGTQRAGLTQALAGPRVGFSTLSSVTKPRTKGISCAVYFCQEQLPSSLAKAACRPGPSATRIGSGCNRTKSGQRLVSQLTIRSSRRRFAARLNSGVSWGQSWVQHFEFSDKAQDQGHFLRCAFLPRAVCIFTR